MGDSSETPAADLLSRNHMLIFFSLRLLLSLLLHNLCFTSTFLLLPVGPRCLLCFLATLQGVGMANKGPSYGLSRQVQDKIDSKYDPDLEQILVEWISRQCGSGVGKPEPGKQGFQAWLKDGCVRVTHINLIVRSLTLHAFPPFKYLFFLLPSVSPCPRHRFWANLSTVCMW